MIQGQRRLPNMHPGMNIRPRVPAINLNNNMQNK